MRVFPPPDVLVLMKSVLADAELCSIKGSAVVGWRLLHLKIPKYAHMCNTRCTQASYKHVTNINNARMPQLTKNEC